MADTPQPGWYEDPNDPSRMRWWQGTSWSDHVQHKPAPGESVPDAPSPAGSAPPPAPPMGQPQVTGGQPLPPGVMPGAPGWAPGQLQMPTQHAGSAITALVLGILSLICCGFLLGIPAVIFGLKAKREIANSQGTRTGSGMATAGIVLGIIGSVLGLIYAVVQVSRGSVF